MEISVDNKMLAFEYILFRLAKWYMKENEIGSYKEFNDNNNFNKLKAIKLHFFVSAINSDKNNLLDLFNRFYAMPYGHVEGDVYNHIEELKNFKIDTKKLSINEYNLDEKAFTLLDLNQKNEIDASIILLNQYNPEIINYNALDLVGLSHTWFSWKSMYSLALSKNKKSEIIPQKLIKEEHKNFELILD